MLRPSWLLPKKQYECQSNEYYPVHFNNQQMSQIDYILLSWSHSKLVRPDY